MTLEPGWIIRPKGENKEKRFDWCPYDRQNFQKRQMMTCHNNPREMPRERPKKNKKEVVNVVPKALGRKSVSFEKAK